MTGERDLTCTTCGRHVIATGADWIDPSLYRCQACLRGETPAQGDLLAEPVREDWHPHQYDPDMSRIPY